MRFKPRYIFESELDSYGLPSCKRQANILALVDGASTLIDEYCGRIDGDGNGSLVYTTYSERLMMQARNRNIVRVSFKPLVTVTAATIATLQGLASTAAAATGTADKSNTWYTGATANTIVRPDGTTSPLISLTGRYGYPRRGEMAIYPDLNYGMNLLQVATYFGGPPTFSPVDVAAVDFETQTGEIWIPAGLYMGQYTEIVATYNSGFDPTDMPEAIKQATANIVRTVMARGGGAGGVRSISGAGAISVQFVESAIDPYTEEMLDKFKNVIAL